MEIITEHIKLKTKGDTDVINITSEVIEILKKSKVNDGIVTIFVPGATGGLTTIEFEPGLIKDTKEMFYDIVKEQKNYFHNGTHSHGNATSHLRASLIGPSLTVPVQNNELQLGIWQGIAFIDFDNRPRNRELIVKIIGIK